LTLVISYIFYTISNIICFICSWMTKHSVHRYFIPENSGFEF